MPTLKVPIPSAEHTRQELIGMCVDLFRTRFNANPLCVASAPGRVNLIGEHTDYNSGYVLPAAINRVVAVAAAGRSDKTLHIYSHNLRASVKVPLDDLQPLKTNAWANYVAGVAYFLKRACLGMTGANICIFGNVPRGAGLSSSAALELASATSLSTLFGGHLSIVELAKLCQQAENEFVGVQCGIMDQYTSAMGKAHHAMFLDCQSLEHEFIPIPHGVRLLICETGLKRRLRNSDYNRRRQECTQAVHQLSSVYPSITSLRDVSLQDFLKSEQSLDPTLRKRVRHVIGENGRVLQSVAALKEGNLGEFGKLMYQSHLSLKLDFEVSCSELDTVVDICAESEGVYGARMTGAGFGGSAVCLVDKDNVNEVRIRLEREYPEKTGCSPTIHQCTSDDGATVLMTRA